MKKIKKETINTILIILAFSFNIAVFAPIELYLTNKKEFWFGLVDILPIIFAVFIILCIVLGIICTLLKNKKEIFKKTIFVTWGDIKNNRGRKFEIH